VRSSQTRSLDASSGSLISETQYTNDVKFHNCRFGCAWHRAKSLR